MPVQNLSELQNIKLEVPDPQLLQGWEPFDGAILYAERGKKYLIFSEDPEIRLPAPDNLNGEIQFLKVSEGIATINPQTHTVEGLLAFDNRGILRVVATDDKWIVTAVTSGVGGGGGSSVFAGSGGGSRQIILSAAAEDFLYESGALTVGVRPFTVSIAQGANEQGVAIDTTVAVEEDPLEFPNLPTNTTVYFWVDTVGNLGYTEAEPLEVDFLPTNGEVENSFRLVSLMGSDDGTAEAYDSSLLPGEYDSESTKPWLAFDGNPFTYWRSGGSPVLRLRKVFPNPVEVTKYVITMPPSIIETINAWTIRGYDGSAWVTVDARSAQTWAVGESKEYIVASPGFYSQYELLTFNQQRNAPKTSLSLDFYAPATTDYVYLIPEGQTYKWEESIQAFTPSPRIFVGEADTDGTKLLAVRPYRVGNRVYQSQVVNANTNTVIPTNMGTKRAIYAASLPEGAASGGVISWDRKCVMVRSSAQGQVTVTGVRNY